MSIIITNISTHDDLTGLNQYRVSINRDEIARFDHVRSEGLAVCLRMAADAVDLAERRKLAAFAATPKQTGEHSELDAVNALRKEEG